MGLTLILATLDGLDVGLLGDVIEFIAATAAATQALWLKRLLSRLTHSDEEKITILVDNKSAIALMKNPVFHRRSKHIDTKYHFIRECVERDDIQVEFVSGDYQKADILTKALPKIRFLTMRQLIGLKDLQGTVCDYEGEYWVKPGLTKPQTSLWARVIKAIYGDDGKVGKVTNAGIRSCWMNIVNEIRVLKNQGVNIFDFMRLKLGKDDTTLDWWWVWSLESSREFSVASVQKVIDEKRLSNVNTMTRWIICVHIKVNVLAWKIKIDALPTRLNISRRGIDIDSILCPICDCGVESSSHLSFSCSLARQVACKISLW
nr:zinc finger, CCHC-type [Tanacetum cinerariifolium]